MSQRAPGPLAAVAASVACVWVGACAHERLPPPKTVQAASAMCPAFTDDGSGPTASTWLRFDGANAVVLGARAAVAIDDASVRAAPTSGARPEQKLYTSRGGRLGARVALDDDAAYVTDGPPDGARTLMRVPLAGGAATTVARLTNDLEPVFADGTYVYVAHQPTGDGKPERFLRVAKTGGELEEIAGVSATGPFAATPGGIVFTRTDHAADGKAIAIALRLDSATKAVRELGRIQSAFAQEPSTPIVAGLRTDGGDVFVALIYGEIDAIPLAGGAPRKVTGTRGGVTGFTMTPRHFLVSTEESYTLQIPRGGAGAASLSELPAMTLFGELRAYDGCVCGAHVTYVHPHSSAHRGEVVCALYPAR
jgi:hypothetical protein